MTKGTLSRGTTALLAALAIALCAIVALRGRRGSLVKRGDRIVFLGDSITAQGTAPSGYVTLIRAALDRTYGPLGVEVIGAGVPGNKVPDLQARLVRDVLSKLPSIVVIYIGINDVWHGEVDPSRGTLPGDFEAGLRELVREIAAIGARVVLCTPSVIGERKGNANPLDARLDEYAEIVRRVAKESERPVCDLRKAFVAYLAKNNAEDVDHGVLTVDRAHMNDAGNRLIAEVILATLGE